ncbi:MAG TPA: peptidoglycan-binding protein, partial [Actinomycetota bacterium]|nr:peptidoglycan-binding protein [Actinomycetota bacterium]
MEIIRLGDRGDAVLDVQRRLGALGYSFPPDERSGVFGPATDQAVRAFQQKRGLLVDGLVGVDTWRELVEASWRLGDRVLYLRAPHVRGDDVRDLQDRLATLGFDVGRVDGIFGPRTQRAVQEFQRNYGIPADGIVAVNSVRALAGLPTIAGDVPASVIREREALRARGATFPGIRIVLDPAHGPSDPGNIGPGGAREADICFSLVRQIEAGLAAAGAQVFLTRREDTEPPHVERVGLANALDADIVLSLHLGGGEARANGAAAYYFGHERFRSDGGARLAELLIEHVCKLGILDARTV